MKNILLFLFASALSILPAAAGSRSSADYSIPTDTIDAGGVNVQSANYSLRGSAVGEFGAAGPGAVTSASYTNKPGYAGQLSDLLALAVSRMTHGNAGTFDFNLPLRGVVGIEPRNSQNSTYTVVFTFANTLTNVATVTATATGGIQPGPSTGQIDPSNAHKYIANLTGVPNAQYITVTLGGVNDADGNFSSTVPAVMGLLVGDSNADGFVNSGDALQTRSRSGQATNSINVRSDVNADGFINSGDSSIVRLRSGNFLP